MGERGGGGAGTCCDEPSLSRTSGAGVAGLTVPVGRGQSRGKMKVELGQM